MSSEIKAIHVASFLHLSARYIGGARTGEPCGGKTATKPFASPKRARAAARPPAHGVRVISARRLQHRSRALLCRHPLACSRQPMQIRR